MITTYYTSYLHYKICEFIQVRMDLGFRSPPPWASRNSVAQVEGLTWYTGAISNAEWEGVALKDVLDYVPCLDMWVKHGKTMP